MIFVFFSKREYCISYIIYCTVLSVTVLNPGIKGGKHWSGWDGVCTCDHVRPSGGISNGPAAADQERVESAAVAFDVIPDWKKRRIIRLVSRDNSFINARNDLFVSSIRPLRTFPRFLRSTRPGTVILILNVVALVVVVVVFSYLE